jgi:hypothetical protein
VNDYDDYLNWCKETGRKPSELAFGCGTSARHTTEMDILLK